MKSKEKTQLTLINNKIPIYKECMRKLTVDEELSNKEKTYVLSIAILLIKSFEADKRHNSYLEFAYYIILKYATIYKDYRPLYDFSINFGFYPIAKDIQKKSLIPNVKLKDDLASLQLDEFKHENYTETLEQKKMRINFLEQNLNNVSYVAPTSYGKSSLIIEHIINHMTLNKKIGIIVPTKSLLVQTYKEVRKSNIKRRIITHDEMYQNEDKFIGVLTQERALRLLEKNQMSFDILYIDEAHNLFEKDNRSILLSRLIRYNGKKNKDQKVIYLSPLINNSENLKLDIQEEIIQQKIEFNMKEPEIFEYRINNEILLYNRFTNEFYPIKKMNETVDEEGYLRYIKEKKGEKNFIYHKSPRKIEQFSRELFNCLPLIEMNPTLINLLKELEEIVHKDFYIIELLKKGIIYLHGRMPEIIKEYLEYQFKNNKDLKFVIANKVILEGINLPIDTLFIMHSNGLKEKEATNLIGRVNRLNEIFGNDNKNQLAKLLPSIHFLNSTYNKKGIKMENLIRKLRSNIFKDEIRNPILVKYDMTKLDDNVEIKKIEKIREYENLILADTADDLEILKKVFIKSGLEHMFSLKDNYLKEIKRRIKRDKDTNDWKRMDIVDKIYYFYIYNIDRSIIIDYEIYRLKFEKARNFYRRHLFAKQTKTLKENIIETFQYFKRRIKEGNADLYIGASFGEKALSTSNYQDSRFEVFVDLKTKSNSELINLAIIKLKLEDDFISYKLNRLIVVLFELELLTDDEYNNIIYGTSNKKKIDLIKTGLSFSLISKLQLDNQIHNIDLDENNNIVVNVNFIEYKKNLNGLYRFELDKFI
ncbi:DEAD/DEAH box helicase [Peribacillus butanolivorans]|uniref:DEAD/DEAH box helicase n=1 Tax=Peribacillus butanolivorans TaxID=421767 RepID=UPI00380D12BE